MTRDDALKLLELTHGYSEAELKLAYRDMLKVWHPDRFPPDSRLQDKATERTRLITEAFGVLNASPPEAPFVPAEEEERTPDPPAEAHTATDGTAAADHPLGSLLATHQAKITALRNPRSVDVRELGLVFRWRGREGEPELIPWERIERLRFWDHGSQSKVYGFVRISYEQYFYMEVRGRDEILLSEGLRDVEALFKRIDKATLGRRTEEIMRRLGSGHSVDLGAFELSPQGVKAKRRVLPWGDVAGAEVHKGNIHVFARTKSKSWAVVGYASTWNATPLMVLLEHSAKHGSWMQS